jgi:hypothetical protein
MNRTELLQIKLTKEEKNSWMKKATDHQMKLSEFVRIVVNQVEQIKISAEITTK